MQILSLICKQRICLDCYNVRCKLSLIRLKKLGLVATATFAAYSPIVQRPYGLGVAKTLLRGWRHRQVCVLDLIL